MGAGGYMRAHVEGVEGASRSYGGAWKGEEAVGSKGRERVKRDD
jgi:hypothetical protein